MKNLSKLKLGLKIDDKKLMNSYLEILSILKELKADNYEYKRSKRKYKTS